MILETGTVIGIVGLGAACWVGEQILDKFGKPHLKATLEWSLFAGALVYILKTVSDGIEVVQRIFL